MALKLPAALDADKPLRDAKGRKAMGRVVSKALPSQEKPSRLEVARQSLAKFDRNAYQREYMRKWRSKKTTSS